MKFVAQHLARGDRAHVRRVVQTSVLTVGAFLGLVLLGFYPLLGWGLAFLIEPAAKVPAALAVLPYALVSFWLLSAASVLQSCLDGLHRIDLRCLLSMAGSVAYLLFVFWLVPERGLIGLAQAQVAQSALLLVGAWAVTKRLLPGLPLVPWRWDPGAFREMLAYSLNFQLISFSRLLFEPVTKSLLSKFGGVGVLAYFEMAHKMVLQLRALVVAAHRAVVPAIADLQERDAARVRSIYATSFRLLLYLILPSLPFLVAMTPTISRLYVGFYEPHFVLFADVLFVGWFLNMLVNPAYFANMGTGTLRPNVWGHVTIGVLNGALGGLLGWLFGSVGVVVGFVVALLAGSALIAALYHRAHDVRLGELAGRASLLLGLAGLAGGAPRALPLQLEPGRAGACRAVGALAAGLRSGGGRPALAASDAEGAASVGRPPLAPPPGSDVRGGLAMRAPHVMLFDLYAGGHRLQYLLNLATHWAERGLPGRLSIVVPTAFLDAHPPLRTFADVHRTSGIEVVPITEPVRLKAPGPLQLVRYGVEQGRHLRRYVERLRPDHAVLMYFDHAQLALAFGLRFDFPVRFSGIYFRPQFHYGRFEGHATSPRERATNLRKRLVLRAALRNPHLHTLFCLDPYAVADVRRMGGRAVALPDGVAPEAGRADVRWAPEDGRRAVLLFGTLHRRKGLFEVLDAMRRLSKDDQRRLALVLAGPITDLERDRALRELGDLATSTPLQVVLDERFIPDEEIQAMVRRADLVLLTYQRHVGSSNVLVRAAMAGRPVLATDYGLVGALVREHRLGQALDAGSPEVIAPALSAFLANPYAVPFSPEAACRYAEANTAEAFARTILEHATSTEAP